MDKNRIMSRTQYEMIDYGEGQPYTMDTYKPHRYGPIVVKSLAYMSAAVVPIVLAVWLPLGWGHLRNINIFEGSSLGGTLTLTQAKAIDFSLKFWTLFTSRSSRLMVFAIITLTAAFAKSLFSNIIAYEAFYEARDADPVRLRQLSGFHMTASGIVQDSNATWRGTPVHMTASDDQQKQFTMQTTSVMQQAVWQNSTTYLNGSAYIAVNVTQATLNQIPSIDMVLHNVPAVKGTIDCKPYSPVDMRYNIPAVNGGYSGTLLQIYFYDAPVNKSTMANDARYFVGIPSDTSALADGSSASYTRSTDFLAYDANGTSMFIGRMAQNIGRTDWVTNNSIPIDTYYGTLKPLASNFTINGNGTCDTVGGGSTNCKYLVWGLSCSITQQQGTLTLSRTAVNETWKMSDEEWDDTTKIIRPSSLKDQSYTLGKIQYQSMKYGVGPALTPTARTCRQKGDGSEGCTPYGPKNFNYETLSHNLLWAEMEIQRVAYEVGALNTSLADNSMYQDVKALGDVQFYRMTYVPALLFAALLFMFLTAALTTVLSVYSGRTISHRTFRVNDTLRLLMDCVASPELVRLVNREEAIVAPNDVVETWAKSLKVRHEAYRGDKGDSTVGESPGIVIVPVVGLSQR